MSDNFCGRCGQYKGLTACPCIVWEIQRDWNYDPDRKPTPDPEWEDCTTVHGSDPSAVAERWAEEEDAQGDYDIVGGSDAHIRLRKLSEDDEEGPWIEYAVAGRSVPEYSAQRVGE